MLSLTSRDAWAEQQRRARDWTQGALTEPQFRCTLVTQNPIPRIQRTVLSYPLNDGADPSWVVTCDGTR
jgi:hypothetical protein